MTPEINIAPNEYFHLFLTWVVKRMNAFWSRYEGKRHPHSNDPVINQYKFTNVYRILDRATQHMLSNVIYNGKDYTDDDMIWRIFLYRHFNLPTTWDQLIREFGDITLNTPINDLIDKLTELRNRKYPIYSPAYMITAPFMCDQDHKERFGIGDVKTKHEGYLRVFDQYFLQAGVIAEVKQAQSLEDLYNTVHRVVGIGDFMAYQVVQDWNYTPLFKFSQNDFVVAGTGTDRGIRRVFDHVTDVEATVRWTHTNFESLLHDHGLYTAFRPLPGWWPQLPDISNCFCETDKYMRGMGIQQTGVHGKQLRNKFKPHRDRINYTFPSHWNIKL